MITYTDEDLCITPLQCKNLKIKYMYINSASDIFENYFKFPRSRDLFL